MEEQEDQALNCRRKDVSAGAYAVQPEMLEWEMNYDPYDCGRNRCAGMCPVLGHEFRMAKRGSVFYDVKISYLRNDLNGTLFEGQVDTRIIKGKKIFRPSGEHGHL